MTTENYPLLLASMESALKAAHAEGEYLSFKQLHAVPEIAANAKGLQQVRDVIATFRAAGCTVQRDLDDNEKHLGGRVGYAWKAGATYTPASPGKARKTAPKPSNVAPVPAGSAPNEVELCINGINLVAGINPATGRIRITIG